MNITADLLAEELYKLEYIRDQMVRTCSASREDIMNVVIDELQEYKLLHKMFFSTDLADFQDKVDELRDTYR